jgi:hypothetical protein
MFMVVDPVNHPTPEYGSGNTDADEGRPDFLFVFHPPSRSKLSLITVSQRHSQFPGAFIFLFHRDFAARGSTFSKISFPTNEFN